MKPQYTRATTDDIPFIAAMLGNLLAEISSAIGSDRVFNFEPTAARAMLADFVTREKNFMFVARAASPAGFIALYEGHAVYAGGAFGTISELYVKPELRSQGIGGGLIATARAFARTRGWQRLEVTTPPLPSFARTLDFYRGLGFEISGGHKLKIAL